MQISDHIQLGIRKRFCLYKSQRLPPGNRLATEIEILEAVKPTEELCFAFDRVAFALEKAEDA